MYLLSSSKILFAALAFLSVWDQITASSIRGRKGVRQRNEKSTKPVAAALPEFLSSSSSFNDPFAVASSTTGRNLGKKKGDGGKKGGKKSSSCVADTTPTPAATYSTVCSRVCDI